MADSAAPPPQGDSGSNRGRSSRGRGGRGANRQRDGQENAQGNGRQPGGNRGRGRGRGGNRPRGESRADQQPPSANESGVAMAPGKARMLGANLHVEEESGEKSQEEGEDIEAEVCFICASPVVHNSVAPCNHRTCHICALRLRALYKTKACAHCRVSPYSSFAAPSRSAILTLPPDGSPNSHFHRRRY